MGVHEKFGFRKVINARGPATLLGAARVSPEIVQDIADILSESAEIWELQRSASKKIVELTGAEAGCVVNCSSAGMAIATAAVLCGDNPAKIKSLPNINWQKKKVIIQKGQVTGAGDCPVWQVIRMCGAEYIEIGEALDCATFHLASVLDEDVAAAFYIMEDTFAPNLLSLETFVSICKSKNVPVICDAAYLTDFKKLWKLGVDIAIYSGHKWLGGCTSGIIAGRKELVHACYLQEMGIGRPMKVGKEGIISVISAINQWLTRDEMLIKTKQTELSMHICNAITNIPGVTCKLTDSEYSPSVRVQVDIDETITGIAAWAINDELGRLNPVIKTDDYYVNHGRVIFDMGYVDEVDVMYIAETLKQYLGGEKRPVFDNTQKGALPRTRQDAIYDLFNAWLDGDPRAF